MNTYRIIFSDNTVLTCAEVNEISKLEGVYYYEHDRDKMIFAIVNAENDEAATKMAEQLVEEMQHKKTTATTR